MKKLFIIIALISALFLIAPKFIGGVVETEYQSALNKLNDNPAITIKSTTFTRNWYNGKVVTEMTILLHQDEIDDIDIIIEDDISFGPLVFTDEGIKFALSYAKSTINFTDLYIEEEVESFIKNKIHLSALLTFSKDIITQITIDEVSKEVDGNFIKSAKAVGKFVLENDSRVYGDFNWAGLSATTAEESLTIDNIEFTLDQTLIAGSYYQGNAISVGDFDFSISTINAKDAIGNQTLLLSNILVNAKSSVKSELLQVNMNYSADKLESPGLSLEKANLDIIFNNLNIIVMQEINTFLTSITGTEEEMFNQENMNKLSVLTNKLLADEPVLEIQDLSVRTPEGKIESKMQINVDKTLFDPANFMSIVPAINATANGKAPTMFFEKLGLTPVIEQYISQGLIIKKDDELSVKLNFSQGKLNINGHVIPL